MRPARLLACALLLSGCAPAPDTAPQAAPPEASAEATAAGAAATAEEIPDAAAGAAEAAADAEAPAPTPAAIPPANGLLDSIAGAEDTLDTLRARYGSENVVAQELSVGEGNTIQGWVLFPDRPTRQIKVFLDETGTHPEMLVASADVTEWQRADGVRNGMTVAELAALNGRPFVFFGFYWDFGGVVIDWKGGTLGPEGGVPGPVMLCPPQFADENIPDDYPSGDGEYASDLPILATFPPVVCEFGVVLAPPPA